MPPKGQISPDELCQLLRPHLRRTPADPRPIALMLCGVSGSGKSTTAKTIPQTFPTFTRVSLDAILASHHGLYAIDYSPDDHETLSAEADALHRETTALLLSQNHDIVLDRAFYDKADRDWYRDLVEKHGGRVVLVYFDVPREILWRRVQERRKAGVDADCAVELTEEILERYVDGFDVPCGEGEIVVRYERDE